MVQFLRSRKNVKDEIAGFGMAAPGVDAVVAVLFAATWVSPNLIWAGMFEMLATYLAAELVVLLALFTLAKGRFAHTRRELRFEWMMVRCVVLLVAAWFILDGGLSWYVLLFVAAALATADFPLRIGSHQNWHELLDRDTWVLMGILMASLLVSAIFGNRVVPGIRFPAEGLLHDLVANDLRLPQQVLSMGTFYFASKAILNGYRHVTDRSTGAAAA
jgi:hypothetical protein